ncbi:hypothetical protein [Clostridium luticellarii]|jgi:hypothetical protein|uniref:hypothetical protein n=1 Tax=Clostridium luticellarii TaxID=1691940 RepID=UPI0023531D06|nr:hypothetical protein [Clostridium luticellarii]MCI1995682.1 hypothetical protein [Clostridium luticellarii]
MSVKTNAASSIAKGGLLTTIGVILIYISSVVPINKGSILTLSSLIIPLAVLITNLRNAFTVYAATCLLSLLICGLKMTVISYVIFFGLYGLVKYYIEKLRKLPFEIILKLIFFNLCITLLFLIYSLFFPGLLKINFHFYAIIIGLQVVFLAYDYLLTLFINYISKYLAKRLK